MVLQACEEGPIAALKIWLTRHGESQYNQKALLGGDSELSDNGNAYAEVLPEVIQSRAPKVGWAPEYWGGLAWDGCGFPALEHHVGAQTSTFEALGPHWVMMGEATGAIYNLDGCDVGWWELVYCQQGVLGIPTTSRFLLVT